MMQLEIPLARQTDPSTSHAAAGKAAEFKARHIALIWDLLTSWKSFGWTPREIAAKLQMDYHAVQRRGAEMERKGLITRGNDVRDNQKVWRAK